MKNKILICGFPHSGTTILQKILSHIDDIEDILYETDIINYTSSKKYILCKNPWIKNEYFEKKYEDYIKIFIIRNPLYIYSSLNKRFNDNIPENHNINTYIKTIKKFIFFQNNPTENVYLIKYEDLFENNYEKLKLIINKLNVKYEDKIFDNSNYINITDQENIKQYKPLNKEHSHYRSWQINQKFENKNNISNIYLNNLQIYEIINDINIKQIYNNDINYINSNNIYYYNLNLNNIKYYFLTYKNEKRKKHMYEEFKNYNIKHIESYEGYTVAESSSLGFSKIFDYAINNFDNNKIFTPFVIFEDDVKKKCNFPNTINIPNNTDILYIGLSSIGINNNINIGTQNNLFCKNIDDNLIQIYNMCSIHGFIICSIKGLLYYQKCFMEDFYKNRIPDISISQIQPYLNVYALKNPLVYQSKDFNGWEDATKININIINNNIIPNNLINNTNISNITIYK